MKIRILWYGLITLLFIIGFTQTCAALTYSGGGEWKNSTEINIKDNSGQDLTNYQVSVVLNSSNFDFSMAQNAGQDIRFTSGDRQLQHWVEEWDVQSERAKIWVRVPYVASGGTTKITMHYGNPLATDISSGTSTFQFFDDFSGNNLAFGNWEQFTTGGGQLSVTSGAVRLIVPNYHPADISRIKSAKDFPINSMFVVKRKKVTTGTDSRGPVIVQGFVDSRNEDRSHMLVSTELERETKVNWILKNSTADVSRTTADLTDLNVAEDTWYTTAVAWYLEDELGKVAFFKNGVRDSRMEFTTTERTNNLNIIKVKAYLSARTYPDVSDNTGYAAFDYAYVRKFVSDEPTVTVGKITGAAAQENTKVTQEPVRINITVPGGVINAVRIFDASAYDASALSEMKASGFNFIMVLTNTENIWSLERFVKTAHENDMQVYAMVFDEMGEPETMITTVEHVVDYNNKSLARFDGINIALDPCTQNINEACEDNLLMLESLRASSGSLPLAVDVPLSYDRSSLQQVSDNVDLFILLTYDDKAGLNSTAAIIDSISAKMGEIRGAGENALIGIAVGEDYMTDTQVQDLIEGLQDYYSQDNAFMGTAIVVYEDYQEYSRVTPSTDENRAIPAFTVLIASSMLLGAVFILKKK
ncbi:MAG: DUF2341 domain-containing protein [Methanolobus sp.]|uniref:DUF2341 domain-containing protein n=1 Tax=Methanolobus sp. TaxID=1874737 RepID=UPI002730096A|nr:DUF2341 domain-containing protein [Methanolobus sp.]MDP2218353.1 DUF2341 domain-containing protein [Methanolobus sp.]